MNQSNQRQKVKQCINEIRAAFGLPPEPKLKMKNPSQNARNN